MSTLNIRFDVSGLGAGIIKDVSKTAAAGISIDETIADETTNGLVNVAFLLADLKAILLVSDEVLTVKTNSSGSPQETIVLAPDVPVYYAPGDAGQTSPFAGNVTALYVTNASGEDASFRIRILSDPTP